MNVLESLPPSIIPVVAVLAAAIVGVVLWRLFKLAMKLVVFVVFLIVVAGAVVWWQPGLVGIGRSVVEDHLGEPLPNVDDISQRARDEVGRRAKDEAADIVDDAIRAKMPSADRPNAATP